MQKDVWDSLAEPWHHFRQKPVEEAMDFLKNAPGNILDLGCGSGRNFTKTNGKLFALDSSENMLRFGKLNAEERNISVNLVKANATSIPFKNKMFDAIILISALHNIENRDECVRELRRILKENAPAMISVWNKNQPRFFFAKKELFIPWRVKDKTYFRYYYLFSKNELKKLLEKNGFFVVEIRGSKEKVFKLFSKNIIAVVRRRE